MKMTWKEIAIRSLVFGVCLFAWSVFAIGSGLVGEPFAAIVGGGLVGFVSYVFGYAACKWTGVI